METNKCPVCGEEITASEKCLQCGFDDIEQSFINEEEGILWRKKVIKYREKYIESCQQRWIDIYFNRKRIKRKNIFLTEYFGYVATIMDIQEKEKRIYDDR